MLEPRATASATTGAETEASLKVILDRVALPVWVVDHEGLVVLANPAALATLGFDDLSELRGRHGHDTVHYKHPDGSPYPAEDCPVLEPSRTGEPVHSNEDWFIRRDGTMFPVSFTSVPIDLPRGLGVVVTFIDMSAQREAEHAARARDVAEARAEELRIARRRIIEAGDAARAELTRDLHDGAQQHFVTAILNLQLAHDRAASDSAGAARLRDEAMEQAREGVTELRRIAAGIHPGILTDLGLGAAVQALATRLPLPVSVIEKLDRRLPTPMEASLYFFISEALTNVVKHARADRAWVRIDVAEQSLTVEVRDDGIGGATASTGGSGLAGLRDRIGALDGELTVSSPPSVGTTLHAAIPLA